MKPGPVGDSGKVTLTYDSGKTVTCLTPDWAGDSRGHQVNGSTGKVVIAGKEIALGGWKSGRVDQLGLDVNGDEIINTEEYKKVSANGSVVLTGKVDGKDVSIRCSEVSVSYDAKKGQVNNVRWRMQGIYGWTGKIGTTAIRILDENLDGKYGTNGKDAIQIGKAKLALPLRKTHRIGEDFYTLKISADGATLDFKKIEDVKVGLVRTPFKGRYLIGLVLDGKEGAFDIQACSRTGIPAGTYNVVYGVVGDPRSPAALFGGRNAGLQYEIQADMKNTLRIGPPLQLVFPAEFKQESPRSKNNDRNKTPSKSSPKGPVISKIGVKKPVGVIGVAGEEYGPVDFNTIRSIREVPRVTVLQGRRTLAKKAMVVKDGRLQDFWMELPRKFSPMSIKVVVVAPIRGLGLVTGVRTLKQIYDNEQVAPPKSDKPSVSTIPWRRPTKKPTRPVVKPKPSKPSSKPSKPSLFDPDPKPVVDPKPDPTTPTVKPKPKPVKPKPVIDNETKAQKLMKLSASYEKLNLHDKAIEMLKKIVKKYPKTKTAIIAQEQLTAEGL
ncbi:MAG: hypothetical protein HN350_18480 [Phycisphaerales bacterium]|nr:hypothetical protein [Phycisphaerales bacterium]